MLGKKYITSRCYIDIDLCKVVNEDQSAEFSPLTWHFIEILIERRGKLVTQEELMRAIAARQGITYYESDKEKCRKFKSDAAKTFAEAGLTKEEIDHILIPIYGKGYVLRPLVDEIELGPVIENYIGGNDEQDGQRAKELRDTVDLLLSQGLSGMMGRHSLMALALKGNACAMFEIGELYYYGYVTLNHQPDFRKAHEWYEKAAAKDHPGAIWSLGYMIMANKYPVAPESEIDYVQAFEFFKRAYALGSLAALTDIGALFEAGQLSGVDFEPTHDCVDDDTRAQRCYELADQKGYHYATNHLAMFYEKKGEMELALAYYLQSSELIADGYTFNKLGFIYEHGRGCKRDPAKACAYYIRSLEDVLPNDVTPWCEFNAGRVYAGRVADQPTYYIDFEKGLQLIYRSLDHMKSIEDRDQPLCELLRILIDCDMDILIHRPKDIELLRFRVTTLVERYLASIQTAGKVDCFDKARKVEILYDRMTQLKKSKF